MAMNAQAAAEQIRNGDFTNADELYDALNGQKEFSKEFDQLLQHIETKVKLDISLYSDLATSARSVDELSAEVNPLNEKDPAFADARARLANVELYQTVKEKGADVVKTVDGKERDQMIAQIVAAAKLEADSELRGASSPESPVAKAFMNEKNEDRRKSIYQKTLNEKIDLALLQSFLVSEEKKINEEMAQKYAGDEKKATEEAKILISARTKELKTKIANLGRAGAEKVKINVEGALGYCAQTAALAEKRLNEYKTNVKKIADRINKGFAKLKDKSKELRGNWQKARAGANKIFEKCNERMANGITSFNEGCKQIWKNKYEIALNVAKALNKNKYEIGADMVAAAGFALAVGTGGTAALVGGTAYAAYTIGRRVLYEAYKQKKEHPDKSYKEIYKNPKFISKTVFSVAAAALSWGIASTAAEAGANVATQTAAEVSKQLAAQRLLRRTVTMVGAVTSNVVGVATAKDAEERKKEWKSLGLSAVGAGVVMWLASCDNDGGRPTEKLRMPGENVAEQDTVTTDTARVAQQPVQEVVSEDQKPEPGLASEEHDDMPEMKEFPDQWNKDMGISKRQFETLKSWYDKLDTTNGEGMDRFYSHASHYAAELSIDSDNPMTAEQVLFKFSRLAAITSVKSGEYGTIGTGSLGTQLNDIYHLLGCGDKLTAEQMEVARKTLDICTLNEAGRADGRMDAEKFFAVAGAGYRGLPVDEDGTLTMTRRIRVIGEGTNCPEDRRVMYEEVGGEERKPEPVEVEPVPANVVKEDNVGEDVRLELEADDLGKGGDEEITAAPEPEEKIIVGATSQMGERPGYEGARAAQNLQEGSPEADAAASGRKKKLTNRMLEELRSQGLVK